MELVVLIGLQAAGKSTFRQHRFDATHVVVSKDLMRNNRRPARRQEQLMREALGAGKPVVVDNTNALTEDRTELIRLAREFSVAAIGYFLPVPLDESLRGNALREGRTRVPNNGVLATAKRLVAPSLAEGFDELYEVTSTGVGDYVVRAFVEGEQ
jgi:predicted kinase